MTQDEIERSVSLLHRRLELIQARQDSQSLLMAALIKTLSDQDRSIPPLLKSALEQSAEHHRQDLQRDLPGSVEHFDLCIAQLKAKLASLQVLGFGRPSATEH